MRKFELLAGPLLLVILVLSGCTEQIETEPASRWKSPLYQDHPLVGQVWKPAEERYATTGEIYGAIKKADFVLIGEKHDNPDHHWLQAKLVSELAAFGRRPALVFEMLTPPQEKPLADYLGKHPLDASGIGAAVGWEKAGWPDWKMYQPIAQQALYNGMPLLAGGLDRDTIKRIVREGPAALGEEKVERLMLREQPAESVRAEMSRVIYESHCEQLPEPMLGPMVSVTLAKDASMADRMIEGRNRPGRDSAALIAGAGHVRGDWGVPMHLRRRLSGEGIVAIGLMEVEKDVMEPAAYSGRYGGGLPFDFVWFTPRVDDNDPCEVFAEQLKKMRERSRAKEGGEEN